ncbi:MAG: cell envelope biogenesis protein OmpA [Myxococcales bacterium]|nr:cell envelope biogenesis protein OmpA [Myxococcales bacterium]
MAGLNKMANRAVVMLGGLSKMIRCLLLITIGLGLSACPKPPVYPACKTDTDCSDKSERCVFGKCEQCIDDKDCSEGQECQRNVCVKKPECQADGDCPSGQSCREERCVEAQASQLRSCEVDQECEENQRCVQGRCEALRSCSTDSDCRENEGCQGGTCLPLVTEKPGEGACADEAGDLWAAVQFEFNGDSLADVARERLDRLARCLREIDSAEIRILGHADERGTEEYNLHLGERRARAVKRYLVNLGVPDSKLPVVSYGENRPIADGQDESSWAKNRRAEFER